MLRSSPSSKNYGFCIGWTALRSGSTIRQDDDFLIFPVRIFCAGYRNSGLD